MPLTSTHPDYEYTPPQGPDPLIEFMASRRRHEGRSPVPAWAREGDPNEMAALGRAAVAAFASCALQEGRGYSPEDVWRLMARCLWHAADAEGVNLRSVIFEAYGEAHSDAEAAGQADPSEEVPLPGLLWATEKLELGLASDALAARTASVG